MKKFNCYLLVAAMFVMMIGAFLPAAAAETNEELTMKEDFLVWVQENKYGTRAGLTVDDVIFYDFGTYQNGRVVAIFIKDQAFTSDLKEFEIGPYAFVHSSTMEDYFVFYHDHTFTKVVDAYKNGLLSDDELARLAKAYGADKITTGPSEKITKIDQDDFETIPDVRPDIVLFAQCITPDEALQDSMDPTLKDLPEQCVLSGITEKKDTVYSSGEKTNIKKIQLFDSMGHLTGVASYADEKLLSEKNARYTFEGDRLSGKTIESRYYEQEEPYGETNSYSYTYDDTGRLTQHVGHAPGCAYYVEKYAYNDAGQIQQYQINYYDNQYDDNGNVTGFYSSEEERAALTYDANGNLSEMNWDNGDSQKFGFDSANQWTTYVSYKDGELFCEMKMEYDVFGRLSSYQLTSGGSTDRTEYKYADSRLVEKNQNGSITEYTYDSYGRLISERETNTKGSYEETVYSYNAFSQLTKKEWKSVNADAGGMAAAEEETISYSYDNDGKLIQKDRSARTDAGTEKTVTQYEYGKKSFTDVFESDYYYDSVAWAVQHAITKGTSAVTFSPWGACTRGQAVTFLWRAAGSEKVTGLTNPFTDVNSTDYFYDAVLWAYKNGVTAGTTETTFCPEEFCSRGQIVTFLWRAEGKPASGANVPFEDVSGDAYFFAPVQWAVGKEVTKGTTETTFSPYEGCTRGQIVTFLYRALAVK